MNRDIAGFISANKVIFIWLAFGSLLYLFRDMFGLVFITYIMCFIAQSIVNALRKVTNLNRRLLIVLLYGVFLVLVGIFLFFLVPVLVAEARSFGEQLPAVMRFIDAWAQANVEESRVLVPAFEQVREYLTPRQMILKGWGMGRAFLESGLQYMSWFLLGLMFSFLVMMDLPRLERGVKSLRHTRLASVYEETADSVVLFARAVGENFRAQLLISALDTVLASAGLLLLGVKSVELLATLVFICGLVPVLGGFISAVPIFLMAVNTGGIMLGVWSMLMMIGISLLEAYFFNPRIVSSVMNINPVMTLIILYIAYSLIGIWGMLLGLPVAVYVYRRICVETHERPACGVG